MLVRSTGERLLDIPCAVCGDRSSGKHYGIYSCDGLDCVFFVGRGSLNSDSGYFQAVPDSSNEVSTEIVSTLAVHKRINMANVQWIRHIGISVALVGSRNVSKPT